MLELEGLTVSYDDHVALRDVDLTVADGEICCLLGPSGSGKSTLLRAVAGLEPPTAGRVAWDRRDLARVPVHRRRFGLMFQDHALFPHRDVLGNVAFGLRMQRVAPGEVDARARAALARVGLTGFESRRVRDLSGGEQQRVALARALAPEPRLLMLDEPLGSLDRALRERLVLELSELLRALAVTALFVTHDQDEAFALADRVVLLRDGRIEQVGAPQEVWARPATEAAARFLGFANILPGTVRGGQVATPLGPLAPPPGARPAGAIVVAVRPEGLHLLAAGRGAIAGTVTGSTFRRDHFLVRVASDAGPLEVAAPGPRRAGEAVGVGVDAAAIVLVPTDRERDVASRSDG
jgi:thiamine transport system ATP-binding protein